MTTTTPIDVRDMAIIHKTFRRAYEEGARLVRTNPMPSAARVTFLADHTDFGLMMLHHHHEGEDLILYPLLVERAPEHASRTEAIDHQHQEVKGKIDAAQDAATKWRTNPTADTGEALAQSFDDLISALIPHLDNEEREIVPLAAVTVTQKEWGEMAQHGIKSIPNNMKFVAFGMILEPLDEADQKFMLSNLPPPVRLLYRLVGKRQWDKYATTLRKGT